MHMNTCVMVGTPVYIHVYAVYVTLVYNDLLKVSCEQLVFTFIPTLDVSSS